MPRRLSIGLTGGIASGKTSVAQRFLELGVPVIDADEAARAVVEPGMPGLAQVVEKFGSAMLNADGKLNRRALRDAVFSDSVLRKDLEAILHPLIRREMEQRAATQVGPYLVTAIPLLVESATPYQFDRILVVDIDEETQLKRVMTRDSSTLAQARAILAAQAARAARLKAADDVLVNSGSISDLRQAVDVLHERYLGLAAAASPPNVS